MTIGSIDESLAVLYRTSRINSQTVTPFTGWLWGGVQQTAVFPAIIPLVSETIFLLFSSPPLLNATLTRVAFLL